MTSPTYNVRLNDDELEYLIAGLDALANAYRAIPCSDEEHQAELMQYIRDCRDCRALQTKLRKVQ